MNPHTAPAKRSIRSISRRFNERTKLKLKLIKSNFDMISRERSLSAVVTAFKPITQRFRSDFEAKQIESALL